MITEQGTLTTEVIFNETKTERYLLRKVWDETKPTITLIMTNPSMADVVIVDMTTLYVINNLFKLGDYGGVDILNMTSNITPKIDTKTSMVLSDKNLEYILQSATTSDKVIIAWGKIGESNRKIRAVQSKLLESLEPFQDKLHMIESHLGETGFHPLAPQIRFTWKLVPFVMPEYLQTKVEDGTTDTTVGQEETTPETPPEEKPDDSTQTQEKANRDKCTGF